VATPSSPGGVVAYGAYVPRHRLPRALIAEALGTGTGTGVGARAVASYDEDSTSMGVEAARRAVAGRERPASIHFATSSPAYADKTNATAIHAALGLGHDGFAVDVAGSVRGATGAWRAAAAGGGLAVLADIRTGRPGSGDESGGGDGAAAFLFGDGDGVIARVVAEESASAEFLDRWRLPGEVASRVWEERFGVEVYLPLIRDVTARALAGARVEAPDHVIVSSPHARAARTAGGAFPKDSIADGGARELGYAGAADSGLALAEVLDRAGPRGLLPDLSHLAGPARARAPATARAHRSGRSARGPGRGLEVRLRRVALPRLWTRAPAAPAGVRGLRRRGPDGARPAGRREGDGGDVHDRPPGVLSLPAGDRRGRRLRCRWALLLPDDRRQAG
jgi:hypothetical protein